MPGVTEEQITAAKQMSAIEFLRRYRPGQLVKAESRGEFQLKELNGAHLFGSGDLFFGDSGHGNPPFLLK